MVNSSQFTPKYFLLTGLPGLEARYPAIMDNSLILAMIKKNSSLHQPMYLFLAMLAFAELSVSASTLPTVLAIFLFGATEIYFEACLLQMFSTHLFSITESGVLLAMPMDSFMSVMLMFPLPFLLTRLPFCGHNAFSHSYCLHSDLIQLPCGDTHLNSILRLCIMTSTFGLNSLLIIVSYGQSKALNTCLSHICAVPVYHVPMISVALMHRFTKHAAPPLHLLLANVYLLVPPVLSTILYSVKTKQIRQGWVQFLLQRKY
uniref:G-protein coupled receptors family 1 profile domain-containing protein n=1 Tax=Chinchilla lanigera TaxID=34839 RepID=A0A8C2YUQ2_CHILA